MFAKIFRLLSILYNFTSLSLGFRYFKAISAYGRCMLIINYLQEFVMTFPKICVLHRPVSSGIRLSEAAYRLYIRNGTEGTTHLQPIYYEFMRRSVPGKYGIKNPDRRADRDRFVTGSELSDPSDRPVYIIFWFSNIFFWGGGIFAWKTSRNIWLFIKKYLLSPWKSTVSYIETVLFSVSVFR